MGQWSLDGGRVEKPGQDGTGSEGGGGCEFRSRTGLKTWPGVPVYKWVGGVREEDSQDVWPEPHMLQRMEQLGFILGQLRFAVLGKQFEGSGRGSGERDAPITADHPFPPQGSLALALPMGPGVVQSLAYHPTEPCLLTAVGGSVQCWREEAYEAEGSTG